ncbi:MAG: hypothetical protein ACP5U1_12255 [Desulfomonilaceae bacterium]
MDTNHLSNLLLFVILAFEGRWRKIAELFLFSLPIVEHLRLGRTEPPSCQSFETLKFDSRRFYENLGRKKGLVFFKKSGSESENEIA